MFSNRPPLGLAQIQTFGGVYAAALANKGSFDDIQPGLDFFAALKKSGNFVPVEGKEATVETGERKKGRVAPAPVRKLERVLIRPMINAPILSAVGVFIGLLLIINSLSGWFFDFRIKQFPTPFPDHPMLGGYLSGHELGATAVTLIVSAKRRIEVPGSSDSATVMKSYRSAIVANSARTVPAFTWGMTVGALLHAKFTWPPSTAVVTSPPLL